MLRRICSIWRSISSSQSQATSTLHEFEEAPAPVLAEPPTNVINLMDALRKGAA